MKLEERLASALRAETGRVEPTTPDLAVIRASAKTLGRRRAAITGACALGAVVAVFASGITDAGPDRSDGIEPIGTPSPSPTTATDPIDTPSPQPTPSTATDPIDTSSWTTYTSDRYGFKVGHPPNWIESPASRNWEFDTDVTDHLSAAHESFAAPSDDVRVSVWDVPLNSVAPAECADLRDRRCVESIAYLEAWVEDYCEASGNTPCAGIEDRAVQLCLEARDCHPGLLVPFRDNLQAFFGGGIYDADAMTVVTVWNAESDDSVTRYAGAQRLLEAFLSTMKVWPASTPFSERR